LRSLFFTLSDLQPQAERGWEVVGKPEIIGYRADPDNWSAPELPEMTIDSEGFQVPCISIGYDGKPFEDTRYLGEDEIDGYMRHHGYKRVYKPRNFRADSIGNGDYGLYCKTCGIYAETGLLPHDAAKLHAERKHHYSLYWP
jgi:hypothetical protein